jgi:ATP dependent DNA ligase domain
MTATEWIIRRDGATVRVYSRNANDWTARLRAIADGAGRIKAKSFTIDGEAVVLGPDGLSRFEELSCGEAADTAILYAFDLIECDGDDLRNLPLLDRKAALARLLRNTGAGIPFNEHIAEGGSVVFAHACRLGAEGIDPAGTADGEMLKVPPVALTLLRRKSAQAQIGPSGRTWTKTGVRPRYTPTSCTGRLETWKPTSCPPSCEQKCEPVLTRSPITVQLPAPATTRARDMSIILHRANRTRRERDRALERTDRRPAAVLWHLQCGCLDVQPAA